MLVVMLLNHVTSSKIDLLTRMKMHENAVGLRKRVCVFLPISWQLNKAGNNFNSGSIGITRQKSLKASQLIKNLGK